MKAKIGRSRWNLWVWIFAFLMTGGIYAASVRFMHPANQSPPAGSSFPWDLITGLDVLCGIAIATGGFTIAAAIYVLNLKDCRPILRASLLASFLGYIAAILGVLSSARSAGPVAGGTHSFLCGMAWALLLVGAVLALEFSPDLCGRFHIPEPARWVGVLNAPLLFLSVILSLLYQSRLAGMLQAIPEKISPLWSTPELPFFFFASSICAGLAVIIFASLHVKRGTDEGLSPERVAALARILTVALFLYLCARIADLLYRGIPVLVWKHNSESMLLGLEIGLMLVPLLFLMEERHIKNPRMVYVCSAIVLAGLMTNRLNTCITAVESAVHVRYFPGWNEWLIAYSIVALGIAGFSIMAKRLPIY